MNIEAAVKKLLNPKGLVAAIVLATPLGAQASLIVNGTFDTDLSGWTQESTTLPSTWVAGEAHVGAPGTPGTSALRQEFFIPTSATSLTISFDYEWQVTPPTLADRFGVLLAYNFAGTGGFNDFLLQEFSDTATFGSVNSFSTSVALAPVSATGPNARISFFLNEFNQDRGTRIELDNVVITASTAAVPAPSTLALVGLVLAGFGWRQQRKAQAS